MSPTRAKRTHPSERQSSPTGTTTPKERGTEETQAQQRERSAGRWLTARPSALGFPDFFRSGLANPWEMIRHVREEMDQLVESLGLSRSGLGTSRSAEYGAGSALWVPDIEVRERPDALVLSADLPGLKRGDINVSVDDGVLTLSGERKQEQREERQGVVRTERSYGSFYRSFPLPAGAQEDRVAASFRDGVLEVTVPLSEERERGHRINIQS